jgi:hypothetical protein
MKRREPTRVTRHPEYSYHPPKIALKEKPTMSFWASLEADVNKGLEIAAVVIGTFLPAEGPLLMEIAQAVANVEAIFATPLATVPAATISAVTQSAVLTSALKQAAAAKAAA